MLLQTNGWDRFSVYFSADYSRNYLLNCYQQLQIENADQKSFENCYPFMYYLEHGKIYYQQAQTSPIHIQPILLFYGLVHLSKACILTANPNYPETTAVLAHGLSTRKRKKQQYSFLDDEVKLQRHGLFPLLAEKLFHMKQLEGEKVKMGDLLKFIPELTPLFIKLMGQQTFLPIHTIDGSFALPKTLLDTYHMTESRFMTYIQQKVGGQVTFRGTDDRRILFDCDSPLHLEPSIIKLNSMDQQYAFPLIREDLAMMPELLLHYLLLYNLGMIARYEIDWWSELIKMMSNEDYPFIESFLEITLKKGPSLIIRYLEGK
ncbi:YaaC family protein [Mesobacillus maritimus]|uniref:YaaC family protein n=1 Tax=Mesobacillus maritimus TaxID=1643336 RepID=UPI0020410D6C|nr:YaaC family protein [Mesobacillus maritimus]MCM3588917.1 YaaC family protein [Mesobacillus maritimus]MCM3672135.1 YaaC family protein [Mesobacillus maritimus]